MSQGQWFPVGVCQYCRCSPCQCVVTPQQQPWYVDTTVLIRIAVALERIAAALAGEDT